VFYNAIALINKDGLDWIFSVCYDWVVRL